MAYSRRKLISVSEPLPFKVSQKDDNQIPVMQIDLELIWSSFDLVSLMTNALRFQIHIQMYIHALVFTPTYATKYTQASIDLITH